MNFLSSINKPVSLKNLEQKIAELRNKPLLPTELVALVSEVARVQLEAASSVQFPDAEPHNLPPDLNTSTAEQRAQGSPLLAAADFPLDLALAEKLVPRILQALQTQTPTLAPLAGKVRELVDATPDFVKNACRSALRKNGPGGKNGEEDCFDRWEREHPLSPSILFFVMHSAIMPSLAVAGRLLGKEHDAERVWEYGHCPVCGSQPLMGRLLGKEGVRMHTCSFCAFEYRAPRIPCPYCLADRSDSGEYLTTEDEPLYLLEVCKNCKTYFKLADFRQMAGPFIAPLDDLSSLMLDVYARQMMFSRPVPSAWGF